MTGTSVLVTGASGFVGSRLAQSLGEQGLRAISLATRGPEAPGRYVFRLPDPRLAQVLAQERPDAIVHCAGASTVGASFLEPDRDFEANVLPTRAVLAAAAACPSRPGVLLLSSAAVYGETPAGPIGESQPERPISPYGFHKQLAELLCREYHQLLGVPTLILRVFSLYGPGLRKQLWWDIARQWHEHGCVRLSGSGDETRDWLHVDDFGRVVAHLLRQARWNGAVLNVGSGLACPVGRVARDLMTALGATTSPHFTHDPRPGDPLHREADLSKLRALGAPAARDLGQGIEEYAAWLHESGALDQGRPCV